MYSEPDGSASSASAVAPVTMPAYPNLTAKACSRFDVSVTDPERKGEGLQAYICYKVNFAAEYADSPAVQSCVVRRFSDFVWLHDTLEEEMRGLLIPAMPDKQLMSRFSPEFVDERRRALQLFLARLLDHAILRQHAYVHLFLTGTDVALNVVRAGLDPGVKKSAAKGFMSFFASASALVTSTIAPGKDRVKSEDDLACEKISEYSVGLQAELALLESQVEAWLTKEKSLGTAWNDLGVSVSTIAVSEGQGRSLSSGDNGGSVDYVPAASAASASSGFSERSLGLGGDAELSRLLSLLGRSSDQLAVLTIKKESEEAVQFLEPLKDAQRTAIAVEAMLKRRSTCLSEYNSCLDVVDAARAKLVLAQGTPGKESKLPALEQTLSNAESAAEGKKFELAQMSVAVRSEFARSQTEKSASLSAIVRSFVRLQLEHSQKITSCWQQVLADAEAKPAV